MKKLERLRQENKILWSRINFLTNENRALADKLYKNLSLTNEQLIRTIDDCVKRKYGIKVD